MAANAILGYTVDHFGWDGGFIILVASCIASIICLIYAFVGERAHHKQKEAEKAALA